MRIMIRTSRLAIWSRRLAAFALPVLVLAVIMHRERMLDSGLFNGLLSFALILAFLAIVAGIAGLIRIWSTGDHGWRRALVGIFFGLIAFSPAMLGIYAYLQYPRVADVATPPGPAPALIDGRPYAEPTPALAERLSEAFPTVTRRTYPLGVAMLFDLVREKMVAKGWDIRREVRPSGSEREASLNAVTMTWLGWRDEVAVVITATEGGTSLAMRSASLAAVEHDLGQNGRRITAFLGDLDAEIVSRNLLNAPAEEAEAAPPVDVEPDEASPQ